MSVLQIGQYSRQYQGSPGCRKNVSPFLTYEEKESILKHKQRNQNTYRQILMDQMKTKLRQKQAQKQKEIQEDLKHEKVFYEKLKKSRQLDSRITGRKKVSSCSFAKPLENDIPTYEANILRKQIKKQKQLTLPPLQSTSVKSHRKSVHQPSIYHLNYPQSQNNYLKYKSLMQIGSRLRDEGMTGSMLLDNEIEELRNKDLWRMERKRFDKTYYKPEKKFKELKNQLKEKQFEIYELLEKSSEIVKSTKNPLKQVRKRLSTQPVYIPDEIQDDDDGRTVLLKSRFRTQFEPKVLDDEDYFYKVPSKSTISSLDQSSIIMTLGQETNTALSQMNQGMMRIQEENPEIQSTDHNDEQNEDQYENNN